MIKTIAGIVIGAAVGFAYYKIVGCSTGTCPITSNPFMSMIWGAMLGLLITGL